MARKSAPTILQEELYPPSAEGAREEMDDARLVDLDGDEESPFLRGQKRVSARRSSLPKKTANRLLFAVVVAAAMLHSWVGCGVAVSLWRTFLALPRGLQRQYRSHRHAERDQGANHGSDGRRYRTQHFFHSAGAAEGAIGADSMGRISQRDALRSQPPDRWKFTSALQWLSPGLVRACR